MNPSEEERDREDMSQTQDEVQNNRKRKGGRGQTLMKSIVRKRSKGIKTKVEYNAKNQGVGKGAINYQSYLGVLAKSMVPISIETWHKVPASTKDKIWNVVMVNSFTLLKIN